MAFRITPKVKIKKDSAGITRQMSHPRQPYTTRSTRGLTAAALPQSRRELADEYLREVLPEFQLDTEMASNLDGDLTRGMQSAEGPKIQFFKEKVGRNQATVSYAQTFDGIPVWEAGVTVKMRRGDQITGSQSSVHHDITVDLPGEDAPYWSDQLDEATVQRLLGIDAASSLRINGTRLLIYKYDEGNRGACDPGDGDDEAQMHTAHPCLAPPPVPDAIHNGRHYVVVDVMFTYGTDAWPDVNWSAFIEPTTGAVLLVRAFVGCVDAFVFDRDPVTSTGDSSIRPTSSTTVLNGVRDRVTLPGLNAPGAGDHVHLRGEFVRITNISPPAAEPPTVELPENFFFNVPSDDFSAVNAYYHCDRLFRMMQEMGFNIAAYFDGTNFPVRVDHRATIGGQTNTVNAQAPGNFAGNGSDGFRFALLERDTQVGMAVDWRVTLHEFGHTILWDNVNSPNFRFAHSAGDSLAAILNDADTAAPDPARTFPWTPITRRHDRSVAAGWAWGGSRDSRFPVGDRRSRDRAGYDREQILSTTLFRLYQAIGGRHADVPVRRFAARFVTYLIFDAVNSLTVFAQPQDAEDFAGVLMESDLGTDDFEGQPGGMAHKVIRWAFEQQGAYQPPGITPPVRTAGAPPEVDVFIDDGRGGEYTPSERMVAETDDVWTRRSADNGTAHQAPLQGQTNFLYVRVGNRGSATARNCTVRLLASDNPIAPVWPDDWSSVASTNAGSIAGGDEKLVGPLDWTPASAGDKALLVSVHTDDDPSNLELVNGTVATAKLAHCDNNIALRRVRVDADTDTDPGGGQTIEAIANLAIPDNDPAGIQSALTFGEACTIANIGLSLDIRHPFIGDLRVRLISPDGHEFLLHDKAGDAANDLITSFASETHAGLASLRGTRTNGDWTLAVADLTGQNAGMLRKWSLTFEMDGEPSVVRRNSSPALAIPDADAQGVSDSIHVERTGDVRSIAVPIRLRHTFIGDLEITLISPSGTEVRLHDRDGGGAADIVTTYTRENVPQLASPEGQPVQGDWTLKVADRVGQDTGTLVDWGLEIVLGSTGPTTVRKESTPGLAIPDEDPNGVSDSLTIGPAGVIAGSKVDVEILHTFIGDLRVALVAPSGEEVVLHSDTGGAAQDLIETYSSQDTSQLRALNGSSGHGEWKLKVADLLGQDTGTLVRWSLELNYQSG